MDNTLRNSFINSVETLICGTLDSSKIRNKISLEQALQCYDTTYNIMNYYNDSYPEIQSVMQFETQKHIMKNAHHIFNVQRYDSEHHELHTIMQFFEKCEYTLTKNMVNAFAPYGQYIKVYHKSSNDTIKCIILSSLSTVLKNNCKKITSLIQKEIITYKYKIIHNLFSNPRFHDRLYKLFKDLFENIQDEENQIEEEFMDINGEMCISPDVLLKKWGRLLHKYNYDISIKNVVEDISQYSNSFQLDTKNGIKHFYKEAFTLFFVQCKINTLLNPTQELHFNSSKNFESIASKIVKSKSLSQKWKENDENSGFYFEDLYKACCNMDIVFIKDAYSLMYSLSNPLCKHFPFTHDCCTQIINTHIEKAFQFNLIQKITTHKDSKELWHIFIQFVSNYFYLTETVYSNGPITQKNEETLLTGQLFISIMKKWEFAKIVSPLIKTPLVEDDFIQQFLLLWIQNIISLSKKIDNNDQILYCFFTLLSHVKEKDIFLHTFIMSAKKRFIHRRFNITLECSIQLHLENIIGKHPFLTEYQNMIRDLQFPPLCWEGQQGLVLNKSSWKHLPIYCFNLHEKLASIFESYTLAYQFNFPDRQLDWILFYSHCSISLSTQEKIGPEIKCCVIAANFLLWIHDMCCELEESKILSIEMIAKTLQCEPSHAQFWCTLLQKNTLLVCNIQNNCWSIHPRALQYSEEKISISLQTPSLKRYHQFCASFTNFNETQKHIGKEEEDDNFSRCLKKARTECMLHRPSIIQAKIVNIMKHQSGEKIEKDELGKKVISSIKLFITDIGLVNQQIEKLKELDYICEPTENVLEYVP